MAKSKLKADIELDRPWDHGGDSRIDRLAGAIAEVRSGSRLSPRTARLLASGMSRMARKVIEEAAEVSLEAVAGNRAAVVSESVDLLYNLVALWSALDVSPSEIWREMDRREETLGMAEKLPKANVGVNQES
jgi:phosphoribosyl-ATP pyrophosphohydrolase